MSTDDCNRDVVLKHQIFVEQRLAKDLQSVNRCIRKVFKCLKIMFLKEKSEKIFIFLPLKRIIMQWFKKCAGILVSQA